jgi:hypothetical protein
MSEGSTPSFTAQGSSSLDQSFEKEKVPVVVQQSTSIYDGGKTAWLTVAGTYVRFPFDSFQGLNSPSDV